ncbi:MAG: sulfotransferase [Pirellulaceae bacterium]|nr:sulfotransferase [Pirellulaceae bacterium]
MPPDDEDHFRKPPWNQAAIWTGADFFALLRILMTGRFAVRPSCWPGCLVDLAFGMANTGLGAIQALVYGARVKRIQLEHDPLFIIGHWRTGTTLLHELLALDPGHTCPTTFQCFLPKHFLLTERFIKGWSGFTLPPSRQFDSIQMGWDRPQEDEFALCNLGIPSPYATIAFPNRLPQNQEYLDLDSIPRRQRERWKKALRRFVQQVHYRKPGRIVLKSPTHTFRLPILLELFPNARFLNLVRHPLAVFQSTIRLWKSLYMLHGYQKPNFEGLAEHVYVTFFRMHERLETTRSHVPQGRFLDIRYEDLVGNTVDTMRGIYERLDLGEFESVRPAIETYTNAHADYRPHRYAPTPDLEREVFQRWRPYYERYGYTGSPANNSD